MRGEVEGDGRHDRPVWNGDPAPLFSRRTVLQAGLVGAATMAYGAALRSPVAEAGVQQDAALAASAYELNQHWLFGGVYVSGAEAPGYSQSGFHDVTLPHTVATLSWGDWDRSTWEQVWIYRKHINQAAVANGRALVDFQGVMTSAAVYLTDPRSASTTAVTCRGRSN